MLAGQRGLAEPEPGEPKLVLAAGVAPALATLSTSCLCWLDYASDEMEPPAGVAPARRPYKGPREAAARRRNGLPSRSLGKGWSQPPVLPWARRAYETRLSAGSTASACARPPSRTAAVETSENPGALTRSCTELIRLPSECITDNALRASKTARLTVMPPTGPLVPATNRGRDDPDAVPDKW